MEFPPKPRCGTKISIWNDWNWYPVLRYHLTNVYIGQFLCRDTLLNRNEVCTLCQSIYDDPNQIHPMSRPWKLCDEVHRNLLPFAHSNIQRLQLAVRSMVFGLDFLTSQFTLYIRSHFLFYAGPAIVNSKILIHLHRTKMNHKLQFLSLFHQNLICTSQISNLNPPIQSQ